MRSYSIAILFSAHEATPQTRQLIAQCRQHMPFASIYLYSTEIPQDIRVQLQKEDVHILPLPQRSRFQLVRQMFTELDADIFVFIPEECDELPDISAMVYQLIEEKKDMVIGMSEDETSTPKDQEIYRQMCAGLYGFSPAQPLSSVRAFSRRFVKSFAAFERGFPVELEWSIHALELDIPYGEHLLNTQVPHAQWRYGGMRQQLSRIILNIQSRPLKWFGRLSGISLGVMLAYKLLFCLHYFGVASFVEMTHSAIGAGIFAVIAFVSMVCGVLLHSLSHIRRDIKRLHFQQHSTL